MKKGFRKQLIAMLFAHYSEELGSRMSEFEGYPDEVESFICEYLDAHCANGHFSRWTGFGNALYVESMEFQKEYSELLKRVE